MEKTSLCLNNIIDNFKNQFSFLSNFSASQIHFKNESFRTVEHAFQAAKTNDSEWFSKIVNAKTPGIAKRLGGKAPLRPDWEDIKLTVMETILRFKFSNHWFRECLRKTKPKELIEGNYWHDNFWGNCLCESCKKTTGKNMLGKLLMKIREEIPEPFQE